MRRHARARRYVLRVSGGVIHLTIPTRGSSKAADRWLRTKTDYVEKRLAETPDPVPFRFGSVLPVLGQDRLVRPVERGRARMTLDALLIPEGSPEQVDRAVRRLVRAACLDAARRDLFIYWSALGVEPRDTRVRDMKTLWGRCAQDGATVLNTRLAFAPREVFSAVAAHEAAHRIVMDHGPEFQETVRRLMPDYDRHDRWLRENGHGLFAYGAT
ncbi:M48 family metallopeptidase [Parvularcula lutaonensis]|uniref:M48 family metallopeptidase n=1 Tax=Parvularcula lutaonensis TaxID=491923 RepID=A0ABV7MEQ6_9PROT|nr:YgjP-like metallopeptidase domain-containing protein [Parvularcula lutaonensis]GGY53361.1 hypothetical protein GCM10007148_23250 [Parvularcula lutaonensis]